MNQMEVLNWLRPLLFLSLVLTVAITPVTHASASSAAEIDADVDAALSELFADTPEAKALAEKATGYLIFPEIFKGGLIVGGQYGEGALRVGGQSKGYYTTSAVSYGLQIGGQTFGYAMFFMSQDALNYLDESDGWDVGTAPTAVWGDKGWSSSLSVSDLEEDILVVFFGQEGVMAGTGIQGTKIKSFNP